MLLHSSASTSTKFDAHSPEPGAEPAAPSPGKPSREKEKSPRLRSKASRSSRARPRRSRAARRARSRRRGRGRCCRCSPSSASRRAAARRARARRRGPRSGRPSTTRQTLEPARVSSSSFSASHTSNSLVWCAGRCLDLCSTGPADRASQNERWRGEHLGVVVGAAGPDQAAARDGAPLPRARGPSVAPARSRESLASRRRCKISAADYRRWIWSAIDTAARRRPWRRTRSCPRVRRARVARERPS